jgi:nucleoside-diphosphate-sugar epimerase
MSHLLCIGMGYSARAVARRALAAGWTVTGSARAEPGLAAIRAMGADAVAFAGPAPSEPLRAALGAASHVLVSVAPAGPALDPVLAAHEADLRASAGIRWIGYLSTVGVYGDHGGGWVDETTPPTPGSERSRWRLAAETAWLALGGRTQVFRLSGIYGPGRSAVDNLRAGTAHRWIKQGQVFNRIHVDDIGLVVMAAMTSASPEQIFNLTDDEPAPPQDVVTYAAGVLGIAPPPEQPFDLADLSPMARSFYAENKRVANQRIKRELGVTLAYPTYREGIDAIVRG